MIMTSRDLFLEELRTLLIDSLIELDRLQLLVQQAEYSLSDSQRIRRLVSQFITQREALEQSFINSRNNLIHTAEDLRLHAEPVMNEMRALMQEASSFILFQPFTTQSAASNQPLI